MVQKLILNGLIVSVSVVSTVVFAAAPETSNKDWPSWRGPNRDGISTETGLLKQWPKSGPPLLWRTEGLGSGYSSIAVSNGRIFTMGRRRGAAYLIALNLSDGKELWATRVGGGTPNCTPTVDGNLAFALGLQGDLLCVEVSTGRELWRKNYGRDFGGKMMSGWGFSESPLVDGDRLICTPGSEDAVIVALDKKTGDLIWKAAAPKIGSRGRKGAAYSSLVISTGGGIKQYVQLVGRGLISVAADDGRVLWSYNRVANGTANIPTPIVSGDYVFSSTGYGAGACLLKLSRDGNRVNAEEQYFLSGKTLQNHHGGMVLIGNHVYCGHRHGQGFPICVELKTGRIKWGGNFRGPGNGSAAILYADGHLYFRYENGVMALIEANPNMYRLKGSFKIASNNGSSWPHPVIAGGKLYLRDQGTLLCYNIKANR
ncbi:MAG: PQQ-like beta-propeller repeat protein [Planctomycetes bacterium]|nr:PQQ-like beta-propeller repeat protein [Planctomycetota bacterium]